MKRLLLLGLLAIAVGVSAGTYVKVRPAGVNNTSTDQFLVVMDSSDTFQVDTFYSDTVDLGLSASAMNIAYQLYGFSLPDSANDSVIIIVKGITSYDGVASYAVFTDTFTTNPLDSVTLTSRILRHNFSPDTLVYNKLWFETVVADSFIMGAGLDTLELRMAYHYLER